MKDKKSFFERLANTIVVDDDNELEEEIEVTSKNKKPARYEEDDDQEDYNEYTQNKVYNKPQATKHIQVNNTPDMEDEEGELSVDVYQTQKDIIIEAMVAGVKPEDLHLTITRDMVVIKGRREANNQVSTDDYFYRELYWGNFSRTILLPHEVDIEQAEAIEKHGLLLLRIPKLDKERHNKIKVKSI